MPKLPIEHGVIISYVPLFADEPPWDLKPGDGREWLQHHGVSGRCHGALWQATPELAICFVLEHGIEIGQHIINWSCGNLSQYFTCYYRAEAECYAVMLMPDLQISKMQFIAAQFHLNNRAMAHSATFEYVYRPIVHASFAVELFREVQLGPTIRVAFAGLNQAAGTIMLPEVALRPASECNEANKFLEAVIQQQIQYRDMHG